MVLFVMVLLLLPKKTLSQKHLCKAQFALANQACKSLPQHGRSSDRGSHDHNNQHQYTRGSRQQHRRHNLSQQETDCCRWVKQIDAACVCGVLSRMPVFMWKPKHKYMVNVHESCTVTFNCTGRFT
ncbi:hypothetical protein MKW94_027803 [Papaver nudicaule]|uniref:Secreted protein n=1 Tax=Papaver nudicaule TaxID=74823 RepID=A0AA41VKE6_PAPNU|nr:hypothetical protein [Papaver nudicaule]